MLGMQTFFYMSIGCVSYAGFGNASPGNLITGQAFSWRVLLDFSPQHIQIKQLL